MKLPVRAFGEEPGEPDQKELVGWLKQRRGRPGDLISFELEGSLAHQAAIDQACVGGLFYAERWSGCITGVEDGVCTAEPAAEPEWVVEDARAVAALRRHTQIALPAPSALGIRDAFFRDEEEWMGALCEVCGRLMREMRDAGVAGHVLHATSFDPLELEELSGKKVLFFCPEPDRSLLEAVLEVQDEVAVPAAAFGDLSAFLDEFDIRGLFLLDASPADLALAAEYYDPDVIRPAGYCTAECGTYWESLAEDAVLVY